MQWYMICFAFGALMLSIGLTIGLLLPRYTNIDSVFLQFYLLFIFVLALSGLVTLPIGLRR